MNLGSTIVKLREKKDLNQGQLAAVLGISQTYLCQIENNKKVPNMGLLETIGKVLSTPLPFLFFLSIDSEDVPLRNREHFETIGPEIKEFITALIHEA
jgi:transcriptional regulator with XRE-family HTH domain